MQKAGIALITLIAMTHLIGCTSMVNHSSSEASTNTSTESTYTKANAESNQAAQSAGTLMRPLRGY